MGRVTHMACTPCLRWVPAGQECPSCGADEVFRGQGCTALLPPDGFECWSCACPIDSADQAACPSCHVTRKAGGEWASVEETMRKVRAPRDPDADYRARQQWLEGHGQLRLCD